jgi:hypothetical protein
LSPASVIAHPRTASRYLRQLAERFGEVAATIVPILEGCACERPCYAGRRSYGDQQERTDTESPANSLKLTRNGSIWYG